MPLILFAACLAWSPVGQGSERTAKEALLEAATNHEAIDKALKQWSGRMHVMHFSNVDDGREIYPVLGPIPPRLFESGQALLRVTESVAFEADLPRGLLFVSQKPVGPMFYVHQIDSRKVKARRPEYCYSHSKSLLTAERFSTVRWAPGSRMRPTRKDLPARQAEHESDWQFTNPIKMLGPNGWKTVELLRFTAARRSDASVTVRDDGALTISTPMIGGLNEYELREHNGKLLFTDVKVNQPLNAKFTKEDLQIDAEQAKTVD